MFSNKPWMVAFMWYTAALLRFFFVDFTADQIPGLGIPGLVSLVTRSWPEVQKYIAVIITHVLGIGDIWAGRGHCLVVTPRYEVRGR